MIEHGAINPLRAGLRGVPHPGLILLVYLALLTACGSAPVVRQPPAIEQAQAADKDARRALQDGELQRAQDYFAQALILQQSLDDTGSAATTLINLATVAHQMNNDESALKWLDKILLENPSIYPPESQLIAAFRKAIILTNMGRLEEADVALQSAEKQCQKKCALRDGIDVLRARLLLLDGKADDALALAQAVIKGSAAGKDEQANALRVVGAAEEKLTRYADALQHFQAALEIDKTLALGARIGEDLAGMARAAGQLGQTGDAALYARRAELVNAGLNNDHEPTAVSANRADEK